MESAPTGGDGETGGFAFFVFFLYKSALSDIKPAILGLNKRKGDKIMAERLFITITGCNHYLGLKPFAVGRLVRLCKESSNDYDGEAIRVDMPFIDTVGYVANSANTVYAGTYSAGRLYDKIDDTAFAEVAFITHSSVIAAVLTPDEASQLTGVGKDAWSGAAQDSSADGTQAQGKTTIGFC